MQLTHPAAASGKKIVLIIGAGFAGLNAAKELADDRDLQVLLVDQNNHHLFQPLLYQVATAGLNPGDIAVPIRSQFSEVANVEVHMERVDSVSLSGQFVRFGSNELRYDYVIIACGARHSYFGHAEWEQFAPGLKTLEQATEIRRRLLLAFENAENELNDSKRVELLTFVIVGGGPTGVEMAGAIADISHTVLADDFKRINTRSTRVILVEAGPRILSSFSEALSKSATEDLKSLGVEVSTGTRVTHISDLGVEVTTDSSPSEPAKEFIAARTVVWAAGVEAAPLEIQPNISRDRARRIEVMSDFSIPGYPNAFVVGDMASFKLDASHLLPGLAPAAIQSGRHAAQMIRASVLGMPRKEFHYLDKGQMATIGKRKAIVQAGVLRLRGFVAWLSWLFVHILFLVGFKNRFSVLLQWAWSYIFAKRGARLITSKEWKNK